MSSSNRQLSLYYFLRCTFVLLTGWWRSSWDHRQKVDIPPFCLRMCPSEAYSCDLKLSWHRLPHFREEFRYRIRMAQMRYPYTLGAMVMQFPLKWHIQKSWVWKVMFLELFRNLFYPYYNLVLRHRSDPNRTSLCQDHRLLPWWGSCQEWTLNRKLSEISRRSKRLNSVLCFSFWMSSSHLVIVVDS